MPLPLMMDAFEDGGSCRPGSAASVTTSSRGIQIQERARGGREPRYHHYVFELFALDRELDLPPTAGRAEPLAANEWQRHREGRLRRPFSPRALGAGTLRRATAVSSVTRVGARQHALG
jgi:hypothetical protein